MNYSKKPVVVIDDDIDDLELAKDVLTNTSLIECRLFADPEDFYKYINNALIHPSIIFLDLNMPRISGFDVLRYIKENPRYQHIPVVILTTSSRREDKLRCYELGADTFITKPSSYTQLKKILGSVTKHFCQPAGTGEISHL